MWSMGESHCNIPKAIFYLLKGELFPVPERGCYRPRGCAEAGPGRSTCRHGRREA